MRKHIAFVTVALSVILPFSAWASFNQPKLQHAVDAVIENAIRQKEVIGIVVFVSEDGKLIYHKAAGLADREAKIPVTENTIFRLASMTKPITSVTALRLIEEGVLQLDDPVTKWLPDFTPALPDGSKPKITIRQLLTHTAGLNYGFFEKKNGTIHQLHVSDGLDSSKISLDENLKNLAKSPLLYTPGTQWHYSLATDVLGAVIEKATGKKLAEIVQEKVTNPLGMKNTRFYFPQDVVLAVPYADAKPEPVRMTEDFSTPWSGIVYAPSRIHTKEHYASGGAGMAGNASDYITFLESIRKHGAPLLKAETAKALAENQINHISMDRFGQGMRWGFLSLVLQDPVKAQTPQHSGTLAWGGVYGTSFWVDKQAKLSVVIMTNTAIARTMGNYPDAIRDAIYAAEE